MGRRDQCPFVVEYGYTTVCSALMDVWIASSLGLFLEKQPRFIPKPLYQYVHRRVLLLHVLPSGQGCGQSLMWAAPISV